MVCLLFYAYLLKVKVSVQATITNIKDSLPVFFQCLLSVIAGHKIKLSNNSKVALMNNLQYTKPNLFKHEFNIVRDEDLAGKLVYKNILHRQATAHMDGKAMELRQAGLARTEVTITEGDTDKVLGVYRKPVIGRTGQILLGDNEYTFSKVSKRLSLRPSYSWTDADGAELITFRMTGIIRNAGEIVVADTVLEPHDRNVLIPLGLFNCINREESSSSAAGS